APPRGERLGEASSQGNQSRCPYKGGFTGGSRASGSILNTEPRRVEEVRDRLNRARLPLPRLAVVILFEAEVTAFIGPGRYVYVTRGLLHRAWWPEGLAMVLAHEMAHHDLGHTRVWTERLDWMRRVPGSLPA